MQRVGIHGPLKGLLVVYSCFSQDAAHLTQITPQGHENKSTSFLKCLSFFGTCPREQEKNKGSWNMGHKG